MVKILALSNEISSGHWVVNEGKLFIKGTEVESFYSEITKMEAAQRTPYMYKDAEGADLTFMA